MRYAHSLARSFSALNMGPASERHFSALHDDMSARVRSLEYTYARLMSTDHNQPIVFEQTLSEAMGNLRPPNDAIA